MTADIIFPNVTAYNVTKFDVRIGEAFRVQLSPDAVGTARWFADKDHVLDITVKDGGASADITATAGGESEIQIQVGGTKVLTLLTTVYEVEASGFQVPAPVIEQA